MKEFKEIPSIDRTLSVKYNLELTTVQEWLKLTHWSTKQFTNDAFDKLIEELLRLKIIEKKLPVEHFLF